MSGEGEPKTKRKIGDKRYPPDPEEQANPGVVDKRKCTDVIFLLLFIMFWIGMVVVSTFGFTEGDVRKLYYPSDIYGNVCGLDNTKIFDKGDIYDFDSALQGKPEENCNTRSDWTPQLTDTMKKNCDFRLDLSDYKYLVFVNPTDERKFGGFCAKKCPKGDKNEMTCPNPNDSGYNTQRDRPTVVLAATAPYCHYKRYSIWFDDEGTSATPVPDATLPPTATKDAEGYYTGYTTLNGKDSQFTIQSAKIDGNDRGVVKCSTFVYRCVPDSSLDSAGSKSVAKAAEIWGQMWGDVIRAWRIFLICFFFSFILGFIWIFLMRYMAKPMVWGTIFLVFALLVVLGYLCYVSAKRKQEDQPDDADDNAVQAQLWLAYFLFFCAFVFLCVIIFLRKKIKLAVAIMEEASDAIGDMPGLIFFPILVFIFLGGFFVYWIAAACYLMSASDPEVEFDSRDDGDSRSRPTEVDFVINKDLRYMLIYHFFGLLWTVGWILAVMFLSIAIAVAVWFFKREEMPTSPVTKAFGATCGNHLGTAAFGSFIIAVVQLIRFLIIFFHEKIEKFGEQTPCQPCVKCLICYCECCLAYLERFLQFISKNAYVQTAMRGKSFCPAAKQAWNTIMANVMRLGTVNFVAEFLTFCGKILIVAATCCLAFYLTNQDWAIQGGDASELNSPLLIVFIVFIMAWYVSELFMHVYESTVLCLVYCFLYDEDKFEGAHCSERLRKFCEDNDDGKKKKDSK